MVIVIFLLKFLRNVQHIQIFQITTNVKILVQQGNLKTFLMNACSIATTPQIYKFQPNLLTFVFLLLHAKNITNNLMILITTHTIAVYLSVKITWDLTQQLESAKIAVLISHISLLICNKFAFKMHLLQHLISTSQISTL